MKTFIKALSAAYKKSNLECADYVQIAPSKLFWSDGITQLTLAQENPVNDVVYLPVSLLKKAKSITFNIDCAVIDGLNIKYSKQRHYFSFNAIKSTNGFRCHSSDFKSVAHAMGEDAVRPYLRGIFVSDNEIVATNGHILALKSICGASGGGIIPANAIMAATTLNSELLVYCSPEFTYIQSGNLTIESKNLAGTYPDYKRIIPSNQDDSCSFNSKDALKGIAKLNLLTDEKIKPITFNGAILFEEMVLVLQKSLLTA